MSALPPGVGLVDIGASLAAHIIEVDAALAQRRADLGAHHGPARPNAETFG